MIKKSLLITSLIISTLCKADHPMPLFINFPKLQKSLPYKSLGMLPTPITKCENLGTHLNHPNIYMKHDGKTGALSNDGTSLFGGNKVRKLEFLLADAAMSNNSVITFGGVGSNHAAATAVYSHQLGMKCFTVLTDQPNSNIVRQNLSIMYKHDAHMILLSEAILQHVMSTFLLYHNSDSKKFPYVIPMGGSTPLGTVGFVNAAFELKEQINQGLLPEPDIIYIPFGSMGSTAGLALGLKAAGINSQIVAVSVVSPDNFNYKKLEQLFTKTNELLHSKDASFPLYTMDNVTLRTEFFSGTYGQFSKAGTNAITCVYDHEDLNLDGTYSANAMAALIHDIQAGSATHKKVLFWNTFYDAPANNQYYYSSLKPCFHKYFEGDIQETD